jgi:hypothetical protein
MIQKIYARKFFIQFYLPFLFLSIYRKLTEDFDGAVRRLNEYETEI